MDRPICCKMALPTSRFLPSQIFTRSSENKAVELMVPSTPAKRREQKRNKRRSYTPSPPTELLDLPEELMLAIFELLSGEDLAFLACASRATSSFEKVSHNYACTSTSDPEKGVFGWECRVGQRSSGSECLQHDSCESLLPSVLPLDGLNLSQDKAAAGMGTSVSAEHCARPSTVSFVGPRSPPARC